MQSRLVNSFNLLAVVLIAIGIVGVCSRGHMVFDPGRVSSGKEWIIYLVAGALMLVNGFLPSANQSPDAKSGDAAKVAPAATATSESASANDQ